eukprot:gene5229-5113_t
MQRNAKTHYPILLVHGLFGFERIGSVQLFHEVKQALRDAGASVFVAQLSATHSNEVRGEQLLAQIRRVLQGTGAPKVNLIGHSQGALAARYAAATAPGKVASVTSVSGPNHGSELADLLRSALTPGHLPETLAEIVATLFADLLSLLSGVGAFNQKYPQGLPQTWGGKGPEQVNGVRYYSWSGVLQGKRQDAEVDPSHGLLRALSRYFTTEPLQNDGMVGRYSSHLGTVIRSDYPLDHLGTLRQGSGQSERRIDPIDLYVQHAERLEKAGL